MCNTCLMESVRASVRTHPTAFERSATAAAQSRAAGAGTARDNLARSAGRVIDLTHVYDDAFPTYDGHPGITMKAINEFGRDRSNLFRLTIFEHTGTHVDAPLHFSADGASLSELDPQKLLCPLCVIDISAKAKDEVNAMVMPEDIERWISVNGAIPEGACFAMHSGWGAKAPGASFRNTTDGKLAFPGFSKAATDLLAELGVAGIAVDTLSLDPGNSTEFAVHYAWLGGGRFGVECVANLDQLPATGATVFVGAPTHRGGTGGPARILAVV